MPSVKTLVEGLRITKEQAKILREKMEVGKGLGYYNKISNGCGIESIGLPEGCFDNCQEAEVHIQYVNHGDSYAITLLKVNGNYRVGCWGDVVEAYDRRKGN